MHHYLIDKDPCAVYVNDWRIATDVPATGLSIPHEIVEDDFLALGRDVVGELCDVLEVYSVVRHLQLHVLRQPDVWAFGLHRLELDIADVGHFAKVYRRVEVVVEEAKPTPVAVALAPTVAVHQTRFGSFALFLLGGTGGITSIAGNPAPQY